MLNIVLVEPEIPANTGNIGRTCVLTGSRLHLVGPIGFELNDRAVQRAGLGYWQSLELRTYKSWQEFERKSLSSGYGGVHLFTKTGPRTYCDTHYSDEDWLVFGKESSGLDRDLLEAHSEQCESIPMCNDDVLSNGPSWHARHEQLHPELRQDICGNFVDARAGRITSLNLSNAVAIVTYEALRQLGFPNMLV